MLRPLFQYTIIGSLLILSCTKKDTQNEVTVVAPEFTYGDSLFFLKEKEYVITPKVTGPGTFTAFPDDLRINNSNGAVTVSLKNRDGEATQTGLRYRIVHHKDDGTKDTTHIVLGGITYQDRIFELSKNENKVTPIYNASPGLQTPPGEYTSSNNKLVIDPNTGEINLERSIAQGLFSDDPENSDWRVVRIDYRTNDAGSTVKNSLEVVIYYYTSIDKIPSNVSGAMKEHQNLLLGITPVTIPDTYAPVDNDIKNIVKAFKPRPPCIVIIGS
ncbi:MAG TPA: hypothetical protein VFS22_01760 [Flavisolibacter sp.]|nr:hypothetical protein [Flavisolibacter sp.]